MSQEFFGGCVFVIGICIIGVSSYNLYRTASGSDDAQAKTFDQSAGFTRTSPPGATVEVYRDNLTGCEWVTRPGQPMTVRVGRDSPAACQVAN